MKTNSILKEALTLSPAERAYIIDTLIATLDQPDRDIDKLWEREAEDRIEAYDQEKIKAISLDSILAKYR